MIIAQTPLPYDFDALEPFVSPRTLQVHYSKHHAGYVERTNQLLETTGTAAMPLEEVVTNAFADGNLDLFNNAAQAWNHQFYWESLSRNGGPPRGQVGRLIEADFGSLAHLQANLVKAATTLFGSGWVWLVVDGGQLKVTRSSNAGNPLVQGTIPLLAIDVWEHAYYLDYENRRGEHVSAIVRNLLNWEFAEQNLLSRFALLANDAGRPAFAPEHA